MIIIGIVIIKKVAGSLVWTVVTIVLLALLAVLYYHYFR